VITISADDARNELGGGTAFAFETQDWRRNGCARNLIGLILERNSVTVSPDAPKLKSFSVATPKSGTIPRSKFLPPTNQQAGSMGTKAIAQMTMIGCKTCSHANSSPKIIATTTIPKKTINQIGTANFGRAIFSLFRQR
jgi:hypothetical protein